MYSKPKYALYQCVTVFALPPVDLSTRDNFSLKYIPLPCGTVFDSLLSRAFIKR